MSINTFGIALREAVEFINNSGDISYSGDITLIEQYSILNHKIDFFIPSSSIAIVYDNGTDVDIKYIEDICRADYNISLIRLDSRDSDVLNVLKVIASISDSLYITGGISSKKVNSYFVCEDTDEFTNDWEKFGKKPPKPPEDLFRKLFSV
ncbi:MAG: hypothetical protein ACRC51_07965 [Cetobacterium sp.]